MNKQEAIEQLEWNVVRTTDFDRAEDVVVFEKAKEIISQIHEPQKVVVPKFIADSIEYCKNKEGYGLLRAMDYCDEYNDTGEWLEHNQETFARAWLFGFEIEQEKLYTVEIPDPNSAGIVTFLHKKEEKVLIGNYFRSDEIPQDAWKKDPSTHLTESEIKQDFEWAWQFAKEVE
ncbi:DUF1642 domain-containing protein [Streptococcus suis]|uniref:DUF1642 domain-containing protein n=3 Tax=Streptococcus suis TaxID=1307 RepID=UPI0038BA99CC